MGGHKRNSPVSVVFTAPIWDIRGEKNVSFHTLVRLAQALGITLSQLVAEENVAGQKRGNNQGKTAIRGDDLGGIVRELNCRRTTLRETAAVLDDVIAGLRQQKASSKLTRVALSSAGPDGVFATSRTDNRAMHKTLANIGFLPVGRLYESSRRPVKPQLFTRAPHPTATETT